MQQYLDLLRHIKDNGTVKTAERTGTGTKAVFGYQMRFDLQDGWPLLTTKKMAWKSILIELLWMISGSRNIKPLVDQGVNIWNEWPFQRWLETIKKANRCPKYSDAWHEMLETYVERIKNERGFADHYGDLGPVYGYLWRNWRGWGSTDIDQLTAVVHTLKTNPDDRRMLVTAWDPSSKADAALPPCHILYQFFVANGKVSCQFYMRSIDVFLGLPFNLASYGALTYMVAMVCGLDAGELIWTGGDVHLYLNHLDKVEEQLSREPRPLPKLLINPYVHDIERFSIHDFQIAEYDPHPPIKAAISV